VFEAEFVHEGGRHHLIDFNPRFYGQMGFDVARNLPSPYFVWLAALGETEQLTRELEASRKWREGQGFVYCNRFFFNLMLSLQKLSGWMSDDERQVWQKWLHDHRERNLAFDSVDAPGDPLPAVAATAREIFMALRHPRSFYRQMIVGP
jgi:D-aspartate ligase